VRILIIVHGLPPLAQGGSEIHAWDLARTLASRHADAVTILTRELDLTKGEHSVRYEERDGIRIAWINQTFRAIRTFSDNYDDDRVTRAAESVIESFAPDVAHVHHLTCLSTGIIGALEARGVPCVMTLHDYWLMCHRGQLLDVDGVRCDGPDSTGCRSCLGPAASLPAWTFAVRRSAGGVIDRLPKRARAAVRSFATDLATASGGRDADEARRGPGARHPQVDEAMRRCRHMRALTADVDHFLAPSRHLLERFVRFGISRDRITVAEYGVEGARVERVGVPDAQAANRVLRLGFLGSLMLSKAPHVLLEAMALLPADRLTLDVYGTPADYHGDRSYRETLRPLLAQAGVTVHGPIAHERVAAALSSIDVLVVPSTWEENSPLVIREAFAAGVVVIASNIGGIPETVVHGRGGLLFEAGKAADLARTLRRLLDTPSLLDELRRSIPEMPSLVQEATTLRARLQEVGESAGARIVPPVSVVPVVPSRIAAIVINYRAADDTLLAIRSLLAVNVPLERVIVVDNDAGGGLRDVFSSVSGAIDYVPMETNVGFPAAVNVGLARAAAGGADSVLLLNSDALIRPDAIVEMAKVMRETGAGVVGPLVLSRSNPDFISTAGIAFNVRTGRMTQPECGRSFDPAMSPAVVPVDAVSGCAMLIDLAVVDRVGPLVAEYFFGFEDIEFCARVRAAGYPTVIATRAVAYHEGGRSVGATSTDRFYYATRNHLKLAKAANPRAARIARLLRASYVVGLNLAYAARSSGAHLPRRLVAVLDGVRDRNRGGVRT
jgi:GT2 family glycosyltransferase/glycosyltransferase involved in cell wall biosynthesis